MDEWVYELQVTARHGQSRPILHFQFERKLVESDLRHIVKTIYALYSSKWRVEAREYFKGEFTERTRFVEPYDWKFFDDAKQDEEEA